VERAIQHLDASYAYQTLDIDMYYLNGLGASALPAMQKILLFTNANKNILLRYRPAFEEITSFSNETTIELRTTQSNWRTWTLRGLMVEAQ
jgi:hypothetical protein